MWPSLDCFYDSGGDIKMGLHNGELAWRLHGTDKICSGLSCTLLAGCELWDGLTNGVRMWSWLIL